MAKQQRATLRHLGQPGLHQRPVIGIEAIGAQQQAVVWQVVWQVVLRQQAAQRAAAAALDHPALECRPRPGHRRRAAHRNRLGLAGQPIQQQAPHARQVVHMLVAVDEIRHAAAGRHKGLPLRRQLIGNLRQRQPAQMGIDQQARQAGHLRPQPGQASADRPALGQVEVQAGLGACRPQTRHLRPIPGPGRAIAEAGESAQPARVHQAGDGLIDALAQAEVIGAQQQGPGGSDRPGEAVQPVRPVRRQASAQHAGPHPRPPAWRRCGPGCPARPGPSRC